MPKGFPASGPWLQRQPIDGVPHLATGPGQPIKELTTRGQGGHHQHGGTVPADPVELLTRGKGDGFPACAGWIRSGMALASTQHGLEGAPMHSVRPGIRPLTSALGGVAMRWGFFLPYRESL